jgi:hypothetical protein
MERAHINGTEPEYEDQSRTGKLVLAVVGEKTFACMRDAYTEALTRMPQAHTYEPQRAARLLMSMTPREMAEALVDRWSDDLLVTS